MQQRKLVLVIYEEGLRPDVLEILDQQGIAHYTLWTGIQGAGQTGKKFGNPIWPGLNDVLLVVIEEAQVRPLIDRLHQLRDSLPITPGIRFVITDAMFV